jgi:hypothetical protein
MRFSKPLKADKTTNMAAAPMATPNMETPVIKLTACVFFLEKKYLRAINRAVFI